MVRVLTLGRSRESGRNRVPLEGPPTCHSFSLLSFGSSPHASMYQYDGLCGLCSTRLASGWNLQ